MDNYATQAKIGKENLDKLTQGYKEVSKAATGAFGGTAIKEATKQAESFRTQLRNSREEIIKLFQSGKVTTSQIYEMARGAGNLKDSMGDAQQAINVLSSDTFKLDVALQGLQVGAAGFQVMTGAAALFGAESEELQKVLVRLNAVMAITNGLKQINDGLQKQTALSMGLNIAAQKAYNIVVGQSVGVLKSFRIALAATGIGVLIIALYELIANFDKLKSVVSGVNLELSKNVDLTQKQLDTTLKSIDAFELEEKQLRLIGKSEEEILRLRREKLFLAITEADLVEQEAKRASDAVAESYAKGSVLSQIPLVGSFISLFYGSEKDLKEAIKRQDEAGKQSTDLLSKYLDLQLELKKIDEDRNKKIQEEALARQEKADAEYRKSLKNRRDLEAEAESKAEAERKKLQEQRIAERKALIEKELADFKTSLVKRRELEAEAEAIAEEERKAASEKRRQQRRAEIEQEIALEKEKNESIKNAAIEVAQITADAIFQITNANRNASFNADIQKLEAQKARELKNKELTDAQKERIEARYQRQIAAIKTKQAQADKAAAISQAIINGALAITKLWVNPGFPTAIPMVAVVAATTAAQIAVIGAQKIPKFAKGTEYVKGGGTETSDSIPAMLSKGERVIDAKTNKLLKGIPNKMIPELLMPSSTVIKDGMDYDRLAKSFSKELANNPQLLVNFDRKGFETFIKSGNTTTQIKNNRNAV